MQDLAQDDRELLLEALHVFHEHVGARGRWRVAAKIARLIGKLGPNDPLGQTAPRPARPRGVPRERGTRPVTPFAARLRELRIERGWTQMQLAQKIGAPACAVGHWEQGVREPSWSRVVALASVLGVSIEELQQPPAATAGPWRRGGPGAGPAEAPQAAG